MVCNYAYELVHENPQTTKTVQSAAPLNGFCSYYE